MKVFVRLLVLAVSSLAAASGCTHSMQVINMHEFQASAFSDEPHIVRVNTTDPSPDKAYSSMIRDGLRKHASVGAVIVAGEPDYDRVPDADATVAVSVDYSGSGANFPITFPGFLVFAHAWNGYNYKAKVVTDLSVKLAGNDQVRTRRLETEYDLRHCDFGRGFWAASGWWMPGYGATSLFAGFYMVSYDEDATPKFTAAIHDAYGDYIANNIVELISSAEVAEATTRRCSHYAMGELVQDPDCG